ncbi:MAG: S-layer homology domain-containing protein [Clostridia bacterium]|nr:S-layer homology domain-containing protein [Clostridia bacterium]
MKKLISLFIATIMLAAAIAAAVPASAANAFSDVAEDRWSAGSIEYAVKEGYMNGVGGGRFDPEGSLTRAMVATVLWRREGSPSPAAPSGFSDVPAGEWYTDAVAWAKEAGVVLGVSETAFDPNGLITREQLATMLFRFSSSAPVSVPERADLSTFADDEKVSSWANEPLEWAVKAGIINGTDGNRLAPDGYATREQFAAIIERYDGSFKLAYNEPVLFSHYTEPDYPLVTDADFYVSADGSDDNDGSFAHPFRTWERARDAVRTLDRTGRSGIKVAFMAGDYGPLQLELTEEDSGTAECPITYCKYGDGDVVFNNGFDVKAEEFSPLDDEEKALFPEKAADRIRKADISDRLTEYDPVTCLILSENGALNLARFPNLYSDGTDYLIQAGKTEDDHHIRIYQQFFKKRIPTYRSVKGMILYGYIITGWYKDMLETDGFTVDPDNGDVIVCVPHPEDAYFMGHLRTEEGFAYDYYQMAILNVSDELDAKGEFWIDGDTGTFYVYDPSGDYHFVGGKSSRIFESEFYYTGEEEGGMLTLGENVGYVTLLGLNFKNSSKYVIRALNHPRGLTIDRCSFSGCASKNMIEIRAANDGEPLDILITRCDFSSAVGRAVLVTEGDNDSFSPDNVYSGGRLFTTGKNVVVDNNFFTLTGLRIGNLAAVCVCLPEPLVSHNYFKRCYWQCVDMNMSVGAVVEYNVFDDACCNGNDTGAIGQSCYFGTCGNRIRYNLFTNMHGDGYSRMNIYLDNAIGTDVVSNLFFNAEGGAMNNDICKFNSFRDNVTVYGKEGCGYTTGHTRAVIEGMTSGDPDPAAHFAWTYGRWVSLFGFFDEHPEYKGYAEENWPGFFDVTTDLGRWEEKEFCENSSLVITGNRGFNAKGESTEYEEMLAQYSTIEDNLSYTLDVNPLFVNPTVGDYRIRDDSGFPDIRFESIGRY